MNFIIREYISILKEDGELDSLLADLLFEQGYTIKYKPEKGRQYGVDILAFKKEKQKVVEIRILTVKRDNITRSAWNGSVNAAKQSLEEILEVYLNKHLTQQEQKLPIRITLATNGVISQNLDLDWTSFKEKHSKDNIVIDFLGIDDITNQVKDDFLFDTLLDKENQALFRKTLAFMDLTDYQYHHYIQLLDALFDKAILRKRELQKLIRLIKLLLDLMFKWSDEVGNLKSAVTLSHITLLKTYNFLTKSNKLKLKYIQEEYFKIYSLSRLIAVDYYNKVNDHYFVEQSVQRYSKNHLEYGLRTWEELGLISILGHFELQQYWVYLQTKNKAGQEIFLRSLTDVNKSLTSFISKNSSLNYPLYDNHLIEFNLAMQFLRMYQKDDFCLNWIEKILISLHNQYRIKQLFPLFRPDYEKLVDIYFGKSKQKLESSMLLASILDWCIILDSEETYDKVIELIKLFEEKISIQTWYPTEDTVDICLAEGYCAKSGNVFSFKNIPSFKEYKNNIIELREKFVEAREFKPYNLGMEVLHHIASFHHKQLPLPYLYHRFVK
ncbi:hypothetical protein KIM67_01385 [Flagellimonas sp. 389]|uniref:hypothetical protein n=1 Tax=Flagellimonas sp. 389 TaxID=2835862 RepID=UPI001BD46AF3|nr:hypothetical protein [Flagellimonas sp. 389]MBS9461044.1 hypothetical protein [Flagellimonas sp. 389]